KENGMKNRNTSENQTTRRILLIAYATALAVAFTVSWQQLARADHVTPPPVPVEVQVLSGNKAFLVGHAVGTQNYVCLPSGTGLKFVLFTPEATLFKFEDNTKQLITHYFSPNPFENGTIRATWQHSLDTSTVWGQVEPGHSAVVTSDAIPWLLLKAVGAEVGPTGGDTLSKTT